MRSSDVLSDKQIENALKAQWKPSLYLLPQIQRMRRLLGATWPDIVRGRDILDLGSGCMRSVDGVIEATKDGWEPWMCRILDCMGAKAIAIDKYPQDPAEPFAAQSCALDLTNSENFPLPYRDASFDIINNNKFIPSLEDRNYLLDVSPAVTNRIDDVRIRLLGTILLREATRLLREGGLYAWNNEVWQKENNILIRKGNIAPFTDLYPPEDAYIPDTAEKSAAA